MYTGSNGRYAMNSVRSNLFTVVASDNVMNKRPRPTFTMIYERVLGTEECENSKEMFAWTFLNQKHQTRSFESNVLKQSRAKNREEE